MKSAWPFVLSFLLLFSVGYASFNQKPQPVRFVPEIAQSGCTASSCHEGIASIRDQSSGMMQQILERGREAGDPEGCIVCHGGDPAAATAEAAHYSAKAAHGSAARPFYPDPGSPWINAHTCGLCHAELIDTQWNSLMMTEAGKIQGTSWTFGSLQGYNHGWGNYDARNPDDESLRRGTETYRAYMGHLRAAEPGAYPDAMSGVRAAPVDLDALADHPEQSAFTYMRAECQRCHLAVRGRAKRGDYRGMGCSACHIPYGNEGVYEGGDPSIDRENPRHLLVHSIQATRETEVTVHGTTYSGIPVETCTTCHDRGKRIGVTYQGLMESAYTSPFTEGGGGQLGLHTKHYMAMQEDIHYQRGMMCQDCHTSIDVHGDGFLAGTNLAQVEIECADCHGTPDAYPWELPLGFGDEFAEDAASGPPRGVRPRGVARELYGGSLERATPYPVEDGYILSARGNPFPEVVRRGDLIVVHTAGGKDLELKPLKFIDAGDELETEPAVAMREISSHIEKMECYSCHASWAPQCYGCHVKVDYSEGKKSFDWIAAGNLHREADHAADAGETGYDCFLAGEVSEQRSYMRFENPPLGVNGEGRVTPVIPGCQPSITVIGAGGETLLLNHIFRSAPGLEGSGPEGQLCIDMSPANPHTNGRARTCESCHLSDKAAGYGIDGGTHTRGWDEPIVVDLMTADGKVLPQSARPQLEPIAGLSGDWSRFVTREGEQVQTVGHHFSLSRPLNNSERAHMDRQGVCLSCHEEIPAESLAVSLLHHTADVLGALPRTADAHASLLNKIFLLSAWVQVGGGAVGGAAFLAGALWLWRRRRARLKASA